MLTLTTNHVSANRFDLEHGDRALLLMYVLGSLSQTASQAKQSVMPTASTILLDISLIVAKAYKWLIKIKAMRVPKVVIVVIVFGR
jgi:hypothetical protein